MDQLAVKSSLLHWRSRIRLRAMERERQRRLLAELRLGPGRQRQIPDQCRCFVRKLERQLTENSRLSIFEIGAVNFRRTSWIVSSPKTMRFDSSKAQKSGRVKSHFNNAP